MKTVRPLLVPGNDKVGEGIHCWGIPAISTCGGKSPACASVCYAHKRGRFAFDQVKKRLRWNYMQSLRDDFAERLIREVKRKGCFVIRVHTGGDYYSPEYADKWLKVMQACERVKFYWYSRSYRVPKIAPYLETMALLPNCRAWYSIDRDTGIPDPVPPGVRLAYLQLEEGEQPERCDLRFAVRKLRKLDLPLLCPHEKGVVENCAGCGICFD